MIQSAWVKNPYGETLNLNLRRSLEDEGLLIFNIDGLGSPKGTVNGQGGPQFSGTRVNSVQIDARHILFTVAVPGQGNNEEDAKEKIFHYFPVGQKITFGINTDRRRVYTEAYVESVDLKEFTKIENAEISLYCGNPYFIDVLEREQEIEAYGSYPAFSFPFSNESFANPLISFGEQAQDVGQGAISYFGGVECGVEIMLYFNFLSSFVNPHITITNHTASSYMGCECARALFYGFSEDVTSRPGDYILINTKVGEKSITYNRGTVSYNMMGDTYWNKNWLTLVPGVNWISVDLHGESPNLVTTLIKWQPLREGV